MTASVDSRSPQGTPNCGHEATRPRWPWVRDHSIASSTEPPHSPPTPMPWMRAQHGQEHRAPDADRVVGRHESDGEGRQPHAQQRRDQRRLAADAVAVMAEDRGADRAGGKADEIGAEGQKRRRQRILVGKEQLAEDQPGRGAVEEKVVPLDCRADRRCDDGFAQLRAVFGLGQRPVLVVAIAMAFLPRFPRFCGASSDGPPPKPQIYAEVQAMAIEQTVTHNFDRHFDAVQRRFRRCARTRTAGRDSAYWLGLFDAITVTGVSR